MNHWYKSMRYLVGSPGGGGGGGGGYANKLLKLVATQNALRGRERRLRLSSRR